MEVARNRGTKYQTFEIEPTFLQFQVPYDETGFD